MKWETKNNSKTMRWIVLKFVNNNNIYAGQLPINFQKEILILSIYFLIKTRENWTTKSLKTVCTIPWALRPPNGKKSNKPVSSILGLNENQLNLTAEKQQILDCDL